MPGQKIFLLVLLAAGVCRAEPPEAYPFEAFDVGLRQAQANQKPLFLYFGRYGCTWCDMTNRRAFVDPQVRLQYTSSYNLVYIDTEGGRRLTLPGGERISEVEFARRAKVRATPLFAFMHPGGRTLGSTYGIKTVEDLLAMHRFITEKRYLSQSLGQYLAQQ